jgi:hypothetical protein
MTNTTHQMIGKGAEYTYEQWIEAGWTDAQLVAAGHMIAVDTRPVMRIEGGKLYDNAKIAADRLVREKVVQCRGPLLRQIPDPNSPGGHFHVHVNVLWLRIELMKYFRFEKYDGRMRDWKRIDGPRELAALLITEAREFFPLERS